MPQAVLNRVLQEIETLDVDELKQLEQAIHARLPRNGGMTTTSDEIAAANALLRETVVNFGYATGSDNDAIDADLAREYGNFGEDTHESDGAK